MTGRLAVDFGTSNTVLAVWDETSSSGRVLWLPDYGRTLQQGNENISLIPSLIHYTSDGRRWIGNQVIQNNLYTSPRTFRWMKRYISHRSPIRQNLDGKAVSYQEAGADFLTSVLVNAQQELGLTDEEIVLSVPVESFEHYEDWLTGVAEKSGLNRFRLIDEPSAAALGYGAHIQPGSVYLIFDFGGGTLHAAVVRIEPDDGASSGRRCRVLGKAGKDLGGSTLDQWLFQDFLRQINHNDYDAEITRVSSALLVECERAKETLTFQDHAVISMMNPDTGAVWDIEYSRTAFEDLLDQNNLFSEIDHTVRRALNASRERGYGEDSIQKVLMVGGSSQIPCVQRVLRQIFGRERVLADHPMDAVARGAAAFAAGIDFYDHIQHDYAIRYVNPSTGTYDYRIIVQRGTPYPTTNAVARLAVKGAFDGQKQLGIAVYEMGSRRHSTHQPQVEIVFDPTGAARVMPVAPDEEERRASFWMNENNPTFLAADPPVHRGEARFEVEFRVDENKRLTLTARDTNTNRLIYQDYPVVKLT
jgi:molecular chaperone DnaK (HSP70)